MLFRLLLAAIVAALVPGPCPAQAVKAAPYNSQLRTDPAVGNVQGIQRYGRSLRTDPDEGEGFSYYVYPVADGWLPGKAPEAKAVPQAPAPDATLPYPPPFDATAGLRRFPVAAAGGGPLAHAIGFTPLAPGTPLDIYHQPLIQVKVRVVEVDRADQLNVSSVLDVIRMRPAAMKNTLITGNNVNMDRRNLSAGTRFPIVDDLITISDSGNNLAALTGAGALVNLTTGNMNYIARLLATEFHSDIITAPEVVTLNGQNVEFMSGSKVPFELGQNVTTGASMSTQQFFYKHVGTYISVTPHIVNWGKLAEGAGKAPLTDPEIPDWNLLVRTLNARLQDKKLAVSVELTKRIAQMVVDSKGDILVPIATKAVILDELSKFSRGELLRLGLPVADNGTCGGCDPDGCDWRAEDCTIDLAVVVRLSDAGTVNLTPIPQMGGTPAPVSVSAESNVRAIADIVQVQSGHGVIMGGLIGDRDVKSVSKVPILGDIPGVGFFFRSKVTNREKSEVLIFIEARVLDPRTERARVQSACDFRLGQAYVAADFLDNPLELGMYRAGFGAYLPPHSADERIFWERLGRKIRKAATELDDMFE
jgi:hypothetical protein